MLLGLCPPHLPGSSSPGPNSDTRADDPRRALTLEAYGEALEAKRKHEDAGVAFLAAGLPEKALQAYRAAGQWRVALMLAKRQQYSEAEVQRLAVQISEELAVSGQPAEGAHVLLQYLNDIDNACSMLTQAKCVHKNYQFVPCHICCIYRPNPLTNGS